MDQRRDFYSRPCGRGDPAGVQLLTGFDHFYSRPCGRGDIVALLTISASPPFLLTPLREGRPAQIASISIVQLLFLLTPLREGRRDRRMPAAASRTISTHAPAGGATASRRGSISAGAFLLTPLREGRLRYITVHCIKCKFLLTPLREGRRYWYSCMRLNPLNFYSRPCGRGDALS